MMKRRLIYVLLLIVSFLPAGCIKDDLSRCDNVIVSFKYLAGRDKDVLNQYIDQVDLYVFDENNRFLDVKHYDDGQLDRNGGTVSFRLDPGAYTFVALGNAGKNTDVSDMNASDFDGIFIQHPSFGSGKPVKTHDHNYLGKKRVEVMESLKKTRDTLELFSSHINVSVEIYGLGSPESGTKSSVPYELAFDNTNARTSFNNKVSDKDKEVCCPDVVYDYDMKCYRTDGLSLLRMDNEGILDKSLCSHHLTLKDLTTGKEMFSTDIYDYVIEHIADMDITKQEALLAIAIRFSSVGVTIGIPEWAVEEVKPEF